MAVFGKMQSNIFSELAISSYLVCVMKNGTYTKYHTTDDAVTAALAFEKKVLTKKLSVIKAMQYKRKNMKSRNALEFAKTAGAANIGICKSKRSVRYMHETHKCGKMSPSTI